MADRAKKDRTEIVVNEFSEESSAAFRESILASARRDSATPIVVYIDSYGGSVDALSTMIETLDEVENPIVTVCIGKAMSCGAILLSHGDYRFCGRHSRVLIHEVSGGAAGNVHDVQVDASEMKRLNEYFMGLLAVNCGLKGGYKELRRHLKTKDGKDMYLTAKEAVKFGIVDAVGLPTLNGMTLFSITANEAKKKNRPTLATASDSSSFKPIKSTKVTKNKSKTKK